MSVDKLRIMELGPVYLTWEGEYFLTPDALTLRFCREALPEGIPEERLCPVRAHLTPIKSLMQGRFVPGPAFTDMYETPRGRMLISNIGRHEPSLAVYMDGITRTDGIECHFDTSLARSDAPVDTLAVLNRLCIHRALLFRDVAVLHAAYIDVGGQAVLFTAPSGTGKSTQAELWRQYAGAEIINGDRALLSLSGGTLYAHGYPVCGSSKISYFRSLPVRAVVILEQGEDNVISEPPESVKIRAFFSAVEVFRWDMQEIDAALNLARLAASAVPVVRYACRPERKAVEILAAHLGL